MIACEHLDLDSGIFCALSSIVIYHICNRIVLLFFTGNMFLQMNKIHELIKKKELESAWPLGSGTDLVNDQWGLPEGAMAMVKRKKGQMENKWNWFLGKCVWGNSFCLSFDRAQQPGIARRTDNSTRALLLDHLLLTLSNGHHAALPRASRATRDETAAAPGTFLVI